MQAVGHRLAVAARKTIYDDATVVSYSGPRPTSAAAVAHLNSLVVTYDAVGTEGQGLSLIHI